MSNDFHGVGIGPLSKILAVNSSIVKSDNEIWKVNDKKSDNKLGKFWNSEKNVLTDGLDHGRYSFS